MDRGDERACERNIDLTDNLRSVFWGVVGTVAVNVLAVVINRNVGVACKGYDRITAVIYF